ncbi:ATP-binding protein [Aliivibrio fischeri]|uniref:ATP-binding protein n=1 Tax=Aliivibrio fischeri TaxID=668 RepID=UPI000A551A6E|nr:ATP-binding protein [Aliivibrio fischeri]
MSLNNAHEGYDYQDLITSYFILKEILDGNLDSVFSIDKKNTIGSIPDRFDDLVITNGAEIQRKQIKYSNDTVSKTLIKDYLSSDAHYSIALHKLFETWKNLKTPNTEFRLCLAWDEPVNEDITRVLELLPERSSFSDFSTKVFKINLDRLWEKNPENFNRWNSLRKYVRDNGIDRSEFNDFCNDLLIEVNLPKASLKFNRPRQLEEILIEQARKLGIEQYPNDDIYISDFLERLAKKSGEYRTRSAQVSTRDILSELRVRTDFGRIEQKFEIDQNKNITSDEKNSAFIKDVISNKKTLLLGEPGAGKSWFLTNLIEYLTRKNHLVIRHYCFTSTNDSYFEERVSSDIFFGNLISDLERHFPQVKQKKQHLYASNLNELNLLLSVIDEPILIVVDGLDHIDRVLNNSGTLSKEKTRIIDFISEIELPDNVSILLGSQPAVEVDTLTDSNDFIKVQLPKWDIENTKELMGRFECEDIPINGQNLSTLLNEKSEGSPLYLTYILKTLNDYQDITAELIDNLPKYDFNLKNYYEYLTSQIGNNTTSEILSCLEFAVSKKELKEIIPMKRHFTSDMKVLSPVISENSSRGGVKLYHDSFRRFNIEKLSSIEDIKEIYEYIANWLINNDFYENDKSYRYLLNYLILSERYEEASAYAEKSFLSKSLYYGHSESLIKNNYKHFLHVAEKSQDWPLFIYSGELHRAISTTNTEENHSQFLENFDLYFEAICSIYGAEKANALLFYNDEKNFSDRIIAKGFMILQKYGYSPQWEKVKKLFEKSITPNNFKYFVNYLIQENKDLSSYFTKAVSIDNTDYLKIFTVEVFKHKGFEEIHNHYQRIDNDENETIALIINDALEGTSCKERLPVNIEQTYKLEPLDLSFIDGYIKENELDRFYFNVKQHAHSAIDTLTEFEKGIPSSNFFHNWLKYFIRLLLIEAKPSNLDKENAIVENIIFLASDTDPYKGTPRVIDFTHSNGGLVDRTIIKSLRYIESKDAWEQVITALNKIPYPTLSIIENNFLNENNIHFILGSYKSFGQSDNEYYSQYADYSFKKSIYYGKINELDEAKKELEKALQLITSYTFRKDTTLTEIIEPLSVINNINQDFAKDYSKRLKYLTDAVMKHTEEGKGIRWLTIDWFEQLLNIDYELATMYLVNEFLTNEYFWKLDYMFVAYLKQSYSVNPVILNFLYKLSPTNNRDDYLDGFLSVITQLVDIDERQAGLSLINLSARDWNDSSHTLTDKVEARFHELMTQFGIVTPISNKNSKNQTLISKSTNQELSVSLIESFCKEVSLRDKNELLEYYEKKDKLSDEDLNYLYFYLEEICNDQLATELLIPIITKKFPSDSEEHSKKIRELIEQLSLSDDIKIFLFINNFIYSKDGCFSSFVDKESLKNAVKIDKNESLRVLAKSLRKIFSNSDFLYKYVANLIIAFEHAGLEDESTLSMYKKSFDFIENRLPDENYFKWESVESVELSDMNHDELAIVVILSKTKKLDVFVQQDAFVAINYLMKYDDTLLIKPFRWFFNNIERFHQLSVAGILELFLVEIDSHSVFLNKIKLELKKAIVIENLYIHNTLQDILDGLDHE